MQPRFLILLLVAAVTTGCAPQTAYRRTALVPAPMGETLTEPMLSRVELSGSVSASSTGYNDLPEVGDSSLHVAQTQMHGSVRWKVGQNAALGVEGSWSDLQMSKPNAYGTPPMRDSSVWGAGPNVSWDFGNPDSNVSYGLAMALVMYSIPYTTYQRITPPDDRKDDGGFDPSAYQVVEEGRDSLLLGRLSGAMRYRVSQPLWLQAGLSVQNQVLNIGFDDVQRDGSTLSAGKFGVVPYLGLIAHPGGSVTLNTQMYVPTGFEPADLATFGVQASVGVHLH